MRDKIAKVNIIPSKSVAHRAYISNMLAAMAEGTKDFSNSLDQDKYVICDLWSDDIIATKGSVNAIISGEEELHIRESGSTLRFLIPVVAAMREKCKRMPVCHLFLTEGRLYDRPLGPLVEELRSHGVKIEHIGEGRISVSGTLSSGIYKLPGNISSQFITGLLMALPIISGDSRIELTTKLESSAYVDITLEVIKAFGISITETTDNNGRTTGYNIPGDQKYVRSKPYVVEGDWSQAAFFLVAGAIGENSVMVTDLNPDSVQGDKSIVDIINAFGGNVALCEDNDVSTGNASYLSHPAELSGITVDVSGIPDLAPAIAVLGAAAKGVSNITGAGRLRIKESDRIESIVSTLKDVGVGAEPDDDSIMISGMDTSSKESMLPIGGTIETMNDHRIAMMAAVLSLITAGKIEITGAACVRKSYPGFFEVFENAGLSGNLVADMKG